MAQGLGPKARSAMLAAFAADAIEDAKQQNKRVLGVVPPYEVYVDGREGAPLTSVQPNGTIRAEFQLVNEVLAWINTQLQMHSPVLTGRYAKSHVFFTDTATTENPNMAPPAEEYVFLNISPMRARSNVDCRRRRRMASTRRSQHWRSEGLAMSRRSRSHIGPHSVVRSSAARRVIAPNYAIRRSS